MLLKKNTEAAQGTAQHTVIELIRRQISPVFSYL